jgi:hypothetical protein
MLGAIIVTAISSAAGILTSVAAVIQAVKGRAEAREAHDVAKRALNGAGEH